MILEESSDALLPNGFDKFFAPPVIICNYKNNMNEKISSQKWNTLTDETMAVSLSAKKMVGHSTHVVQSLYNFYVFSSGVVCMLLEPHTMILHDPCFKPLNMICTLINNSNWINVSLPKKSVRQKYILLSYLTNDRPKIVQFIGHFSAITWATYSRTSFACRRLSAQNI